MQPLVILLVGGRSTRFWPLGEKPLLKFCGKTLFEHQVEFLQKAGLKEILVVGQKDNLPLLKAIKIKNAKLVFGEQKNLEMGMAGALLDTAELWTGREILIVSSNDVIEPAGLKKLLKEAKKPVNAGAILAQKVKTYFPGGYVKLRGKFLQALVEKPGAGNEPSDLINLVLHSHRDSRTLLEALEKAQSSRDDIYETALTTLAQKQDYAVVEYTGYWQALKYPWHALKLNQYFLQQNKTKIHKTAQIAKSAVIKGKNVVIEAGVRVFEHATVCGPVYLGKNAIVGNNALVRESDIEAGGVVGYNTEVARSLWQPDCQTHINYSGDSVWGENVSMGAGAITANYRLDGGKINSMVKGEKTDTQIHKFGCAIGANSHLGVGVTISPGIKIGHDCLVGSQILLNEDLPDEQFVYFKNNEVKIVQNREKKLK